MTSQNHGFGISSEDIDNNQNIEVTHLNLNDDTIEGIKLKIEIVFPFNIIQNHLQDLMIQDIYLINLSII